MPRTGFQSVGLPDPVILKIDQYLEADKTYRSRGELVKTAVLDWIKRNGA